MPAFRFLHVSDLHIAARSRVVGLSDLKRPGYPWPGFGSPETDGIGLGLCSTHDPYVLEGVARHVHQNADSFDAVVLTGDVATTGAAADMEAARRFVESEASDLWLTEDDTPTLAASTRQVALIPGNHDRYDGPKMLPRSDQFDRAFAAYWSAGSSAQTIGVFEKDAAYSAIVGLDLSLRNRHDAEVRWGVWGQGRSYSDVLDRAVEITEALRVAFAGVFVLWAVHFPPGFPGIEPELSLIHPQSLTWAASQCGVRLLMTGHTHLREMYEADHGVFVACAGSASQFGEPEHSIGVLDVDVDSGRVQVTSRHLRWYVQRAEWIPVDDGMTVDL